MKIQLTQKREFLRCSVVDTPCFQTAEDLGLVPGWETDSRRPCGTRLGGGEGGGGVEGEQKKDQERKKNQKV